MPVSLITDLYRYTACDIADALLVLKVPNAGYIPDLHIRAAGPSRSSTSNNITIAPASTVLMVSKTSTEHDVAGNIAEDKHWVDLTQPETIVVIQQAEGQVCAVLGGIMAARMKVLKTKGVVVNGRVRDIEQLKESGLLVSFLSRIDIVSSKHNHEFKNKFRLPTIS